MWWIYGVGLGRAGRGRFVIIPFIITAPAQWTLRIHLSLTGGVCRLSARFTLQFVQLPMMLIAVVVAIAIAVAVDGFWA